MDAGSSGSIPLLPTTESINIGFSHRVRSEIANSIEEIPIGREASGTTAWLVPYRSGVVVHFVKLRKPGFGEG